MSAHPYRHCRNCGIITPFFYDFNNNEWCCFLCGHPLEVPEHELEDKGKIRNNKKWEK